MSDQYSGPLGGGPPGLTPPQALDAERSILAAMLLDHESIAKAVEAMDADAFYRRAHQKVYLAIVSLYNRNEPADIITVTEELRRLGDLEAVGGTVAVAALLDAATSAANVEYYVKIVREKYVLRQLIKVTSEVQQRCYAASENTDDLLDDAEAKVFAIADQSVRKGFHSIGEMIMPSMKYVEDLMERKIHVTGVPSGFPDLDSLTSGFQNGDLIILAGRPSMGKTAMALSLAENVAIEGGVPVAICSLEMSESQLALRMLCSQSNVSMQDLRTGYLGKEAWTALSNGASRLYKAPVMIDDSPGLSLMDIRAKTRRLKAEGKLGLLIIDYLQLMRPDSSAENRVQEISQISRGLKVLAKELNVPVIALSQLSRAVETRGGGGRPQLSDLRDSGSIEQDADVVMFVYREVVYKPDTAEKNKAQLIIAKQRNGPIDDVNLTFLGYCTRFVPYSASMPGETDSGY